MLFDFPELLNRVCKELGFFFNVITREFVDIVDVSILVALKLNFGLFVAGK